jgi:hypothetical protein
MILKSQRPPRDSAQEEDPRQDLNPPPRVSYAHRRQMKARAALLSAISHEQATRRAVRYFVDGKPRSYRDRKDFAMDAARLTKSKNTVVSQFELSALS